MAMHLNTHGLQQRGFHLVACYEAFTKGQKKLIVECYKNDGEFLVRNYSKGEHAWDNIYTDKNKANAEVNRLLGLRAWHRRTY